MIFNYQEICSDLFRGLPQRVKDVIIRRFGLKTGKRETLEAIGKDYEITRERIRQIQEVGLSRLKERAEKYQAPLQFFFQTLKTTGDLRKEDVLLQVLGPGEQSHIFFFLSLGEQFERFSGDRDFHPLWTINRDSLSLAQEVVGSFQNYLRETERPLKIKDYKPLASYPISLIALFSYLEASKKICQGLEGTWGLNEWPEINPRGARDMAYLVLRSQKKTLHFTEIAEEINKTRFIERGQKKVLVQTVHNELIRDPRFVLVGRGLYALKDWGYIKGTVNDVIVRLLELEGSLKEEEIVRKVLEKRFVERSTILQNLRDKKRFKKNIDNKYTLIS